MAFAVIKDRIALDRKGRIFIQVLFFIPFLKTIYKNSGTKI